METKNNFYEKLSKEGKEEYDFLEKSNPHTDKFRYLMDHPTSEKYPHFGDKDLEYLAKEDLGTLEEIYPDDAEKYMSL